MFFEAMVDRLQTEFDVSQQRAVDVVNERLQILVERTGAIRAIKSLGTTVASQTSYALDSTVLRVLSVKATYSTGTTIYQGSEGIQAMWDADAALVTGSGGTDAFYALDYDTDSDSNTVNLRLWPTPSESGVTITGLVAVRPATLTYSSSTVLPIPLDQHEALLAGAEARLLAEDDRQDEVTLKLQDFEAGVAALRRQVADRAKGNRGHRLRFAGYDFDRCRA